MSCLLHFDESIHVVPLLRSGLRRPRPDEYAGRGGSVERCQQVRSELLVDRTVMSAERLSGNCLHYRGGIGHQGVSRFLFFERIEGQDNSFSSHSRGIAQIEVMINRKTKMRLIQTYAPYGCQTNEQYMRFLDDLTAVIDEERSTFTDKIGGFSAIFTSVIRGFWTENTGFRWTITA